LVAETLGVPVGEAALPGGVEGCAACLGRFGASAGGGDLLGYDVVDVHDVGSWTTGAGPTGYSGPVQAPFSATNTGCTSVPMAAQAMTGQTVGPPSTRSVTVTVQPGPAGARDVIGAGTRASLSGRPGRWTFVH
jgi:hypothetical protein